MNYEEKYLLLLKRNRLFIIFGLMALMLTQIFMISKVYDLLISQRNLLIALIIELPILAVVFSLAWHYFEIKYLEEKE